MKTWFKALKTLENEIFVLWPSLERLEVAIIDDEINWEGGFILKGKWGGKHAYPCHEPGKWQGWYCFSAHASINFKKLLGLFSPIFLFPSPIF